MPAFRLGAESSTLYQYDIGGQDSESRINFICHIGISLQLYNKISASSSAVRMIQMNPPMTIDEANEASAISSCASANLTVDEQLQIQVFVDEVYSEYEAEKIRPNRQYTILPHSIPADDERPFRRFSCAGFVVEAYQEAGIQLIQSEFNRMPMVTLDTLKIAYPDRARELDSSKIRERYGLVGDGPWPVLLPGYIVNSLYRDSDIVRNSPYIVSNGDEYFPSLSQPNPPPGTEAVIPAA